MAPPSKGGTEIEMKPVPLRVYPASTGPMELPMPQTIYVIAEAEALSSGVTVPIR